MYKLLFFSFLIFAFPTSAQLVQVHERAWEQAPLCWSADSYGNFYWLNESGVLSITDTLGQLKQQLSDIKLLGIRKLDAQWGVRLFGFAVGDQTVHWFDWRLGNWQERALSPDNFVQLASPTSDGGLFVFMPDQWSLAKLRPNGDMQWQAQAKLPQIAENQPPTQLYTRGNSLCVFYGNTQGALFDAFGGLQMLMTSSNGEYLVGFAEDCWLLASEEKLVLQTLQGQRTEYAMPQGQFLGWALSENHLFGIQEKRLCIFIRN